MQEAMGTNFEHAPVHFYIKSFLSDLDNVGIASGDGSAATVLRLQEACTRTAILERSFGNIATQPTKETDLRQRLDGMWHCIDAAKRYTDIYLELRVEDYLLVPFGVFAQFAYSFVVLVRASLLEMAGWDVKALRSFVDFSSLLKQASQRYDDVSKSHPDGLTLKNDAFTKWSSRIKWAKSFYDTKFLSMGSDVPVAIRPSAANRATDANETQESYRVLPITAEVPVDLSTNPFTFGASSWPTFDDLSVFLGDIDYGLAEV